MRRGRRSALTRWALAVLMGLTVLIFLLGTSRGAAPSSIVTPAATATHAYDGRSSALRFADRRLVAATDPNVSLEAAAPGANSRPADCHRCEQRSALQIHADLPTAAGRINVAASWSLSAITVTRVRQTSETEATDAAGAINAPLDVTQAGEQFVRVGASPENLNATYDSLGGTLPRTYAFDKATFDWIGNDPAALKNLGDLPGAPPTVYRILEPPAGTAIQRGIVPGGVFGGAGGVPEVFFPEGW